MKKLSIGTVAGTMISGKGIIYTQEEKLIISKNSACTATKTIRIN